MVTPRRKLRRRLATRSSHFATYILNQKTSYPGPAPRMSGLPFSLERVAVSMGTDAFFFFFFSMALLRTLNHVGSPRWDSTAPSAP